MSSLARRTLSAAALALSFSVLPAANAAVITENFTFSGADYANTAQATGFITFDTDTYATNGNQLYFGDIQGFSMTVSGATAGDGTYSLADFSNIFFSSSSPFDWSQPLLGQNSWGPTGGDGAFSFVAQPGSAPNAFSPFEMVANGGTGDLMKLTSMVPAAPAAPVPEPETYMLMGIASAALAYARRRNNKKQQGTAEAQPSGLLAA